MVSENPSKPVLRYIDPKGESAADENRAAAIRYDDLLKQIRSCKGFEDFMRPKRFSALTSSPAFAHMTSILVFISVNEVRCDAVAILCSGDVKQVELPRLSHARAENLRASWTKRLGHYRGRRRWHEREGLGDTATSGKTGKRMRTLRQLWTWVVEPILKALDLVSDLMILSC